MHSAIIESVAARRHKLPLAFAKVLEPPTSHSICVKTSRSGAPGRGAAVRALDGEKLRAVRERGCDDAGDMPATGAIVSAVSMPRHMARKEHEFNR